jgi:ferredoxin
MPKKYHIETKTTRIDLGYVFKFKIVRGENCINCAKCTKTCIYEAHKRRKDDPRKMAEPNTVVCRNCFRCIQECPRGALEKSIDSDFSNIGGSFWKPDMLLSLWKQAEDGKVPVSGSGYRGPFTGTGFDSIWTDMSEIVRPTRDGIHGREYISTSVDLGHKINHLAFDSDGRLTSSVPPNLELPIPILFDIPTDCLSPHIKEALITAAVNINTCIILPTDEITAETDKYVGNLIPCVKHNEIDKHQSVLKKVRLVAIEYCDAMLNDFASLKEKIKKISPALIIIRIPAVDGVERIVAKLTRSGAEIIQIMADYRGQVFANSTGLDNHHLKDIIKSVHLRLVEDNIRDEVTIIASGGIAMAEHVPKAMLCGADLIAVDIPLMIALGVRIYEEPEKLMVFPEDIDKIPVSILAQRIDNLMGAWHLQILEVMGAMGIREARRLRGESGRAIFFEEIDQETFGNLFKKTEDLDL